MPNIIKVGGGGLNTKDLAPNVTSLTLTGGNAKIDVSFRGVIAEYLPLVRTYRVVGKVGGIPTSPTDGVYVDVAPGTAGNATKSTVLTGLTNGVQYTVRVYIRCTFGWQTSPDAKGVATPMAGILLSAMPLMTRVKIKENNVGQDHLVVRHNAYGTTRTQMLRRYIHSERQWNTIRVSTYATCTLDAWFNGTYLNSIETNVRAQITPVNIPYTISGINFTLSSLSRKVFAASATELGFTSAYMNREGLAFSNAAQLKIAHDSSGTAKPHWTRSPAKSVESYAWDVFHIQFNGDLSTWTTDQVLSALPSFTLPADFLLNPTPNPDGSYSPLVA